MARYATGPNGRRQAAPNSQPGHEPEPSSLDEVVDWMSWGHPELYRMVHEGMDLPAASDVAYRWKQLGTHLDEAAELFSELLTSSTADWEGVAADTARDSMARLANWTRQTSEGAATVAKCLEQQVSNAALAQQTMPEPPSSGPVPVPAPAPAPVGSPEAVAGAGTIPSGASSFRSQGFIEAPQLTQDQAMLYERDAEAHRRAAEVMRQFQDDSRSVYGQVTSFQEPARPASLLRAESRGNTEDTGGGRYELFTGGQSQQDWQQLEYGSGSGALTQAASNPAAFGSGVPGTAGSYPGAPGYGGAGGSGSGWAGSAAGGAVFGGTPSGSDGSGGARFAGSGGMFGGSPQDRGNQQGAGKFAAAPGELARGGAGTPVGGMMPGVAPNTDTRDQDYDRSHLLHDDDDLFGVQPTAPPVIGQDYLDAR